MSDIIYDFQPAKFCAIDGKKVNFPFLFQLLDNCLENDNPAILNVTPHRKEIVAKNLGWSLNTFSNRFGQELQKLRKQHIVIESKQSQDCGTTTYEFNSDFIDVRFTPAKLDQIWKEKWDEEAWKAYEENKKEWSGYKELDLIRNEWKELSKDELIKEFAKFYDLSVESAADEIGEMSVEEFLKFREGEIQYILESSDVDFGQQLERSLYSDITGNYDWE